MSEQNHWKHTWPSARVLGQFIVSNRHLFEGKRVLELGSGATGVCGLTAGKVGAKSVTLTDHPALEQAFSILQKNIAQNGLQNVCTIQGLDWNEPNFESLQKVDLIIASDVFYDPEVFQPLISTIDALLTRYPEALLYFAYQDRDDWFIGGDLLERSLSASLVRSIQAESYTIQIGTIYRLDMAQGKVFAGIEGGATSSKLVFLNEKAESLGVFEGAGTNLYLNGLEQTANDIANWVRKAKSEIGIKGPLESLGMGLSGAEDPRLNDRLVEYLMDNHGDVTKAAHLVSDSVTCIGASFKNGGVVVIAGTGSSCRMLTEDGEERQVGGWGHMIGDQGSGHWIANRALRHLFNVDDGVEKSVGSVETLRTVVLEYFQIEDKVQVLDFLYAKFVKSEVAKLTTKLAENASDPVIAGIFYEGGWELGKHVAAISRHMSEAMRQDMPIVMVGNVFKSWPLLKKGFIDAVRQLSPHPIQSIHLHHLTETNAFGAAALASKRIDHDLPFNHQPHLFETIHL
ncbi:unnamed protein product, partial [Mesorhabditis belari]|uniref:N-acetyl-D-glucosamine kinase n=1 Tax=Mesorhabditis belari TaxID=2138241 RepID=A0AAF3FGK8_9BILA